MYGPNFEPGDPHGRQAFYRAIRFACRVACLAFYDLKVVGRRSVPSRGGLILASNHQSFMDPVLLGVTALRPLAYLARRDLFRSRGFGCLLRGLNSIPVAADVLSPEGLKRAVRVLKRGWPLVVFPEGTRSVDGRLGPLHAGVGLLAARAGVPVIPVRILGAFSAWPRHRRLPRLRGRIAIAFGPLLVYDSQTDTYDSFVEKIAGALRGLGEGYFRPYGIREEIMGER